MRSTALQGLRWAFDALAVQVTEQSAPKLEHGGNAPQKSSSVYRSRIRAQKKCPLLYAASRNTATFNFPYSIENGVNRRQELTGVVTPGA